MDTTVAAAVVAVALASAKDVTSQALKDGYAGLKALIIRKLGKKAKGVTSALDQVEKMPDSKVLQNQLKGRLTRSGVDQDPEVAEQARTLFGLLKQGGILVPVRGNIIIAGDQSAVSVGDGNITLSSQAQVYGDVRAGGSTPLNYGDVKTGGSTPVNTQEGRSSKGGAGSDEGAGE